jgi:hypothetical protein
LTQKSNNVDYPIINFLNGNICIGTTANPTYRIDLVGDINITGYYRVNSTIYKPANTVLADTETKLATGRNISGTLFDGTIDINIDYNVLNNRPITVVTSTTNFQVSSSYNMILGTVTGTIERLNVGGNIRATGNISVETNLTVTGTNT